MMKRLLLAVLACLAFTGAACKSSQPVDETAAIRTALQNYLSQRGNLNMAGMDVDVQVMRMDGQTADVNVTFRAKQGGGEMQMAYQLERQGNAWVVKGSRSGMGGAGHPAVGEGSETPGAGELPPAHPPIAAPESSPQPPTKKP